MKYWTKRVISLILCVMMLVTAIPQQVYANTNVSNISNVSFNVDDTLENSDEENSEILEELKALGGDSHTTEAVLQQLYNMGLLDDEGALVTSTQIMVDGTAMSLEEVKALIETPGTDLGKKVSVDGTQITLKSLQTMLEIEDELARIEAEYFSGCEVEITNEHRKTYTDLLNYLQNNQLVLEAEEEVYINHDGRIKVTQDNSADDKVVFTFTLVDKNDSDTLLKPEGYAVTAEYTTLDGSAMAGKHYTAVSGTVTLNEANNFTAMVEVPKLTIDTTDLGTGENDKFSRWNGLQTFYFYVKNPVNALLLSDSREGEYGQTFKVELTNNYEWAEFISIYDPGQRRYYSGAVISETTVEVKRRDEKNAEGQMKKEVVNEFGLSDVLKQGYADGLYKGVLTVITTLLLGDNYRSIGDNNRRIGDYKSSFSASSHNNETDISENFKEWSEKATITLTWGEPGYPEDTTAGVYKGNWPSLDQFGENGTCVYNPFGISVTLTDICRLRMNTVTFLLPTDNIPKVNDITAPVGSYMTGSSIPITVTYSQPVKTDDIKLVLENGMELTPVETETTAKRVTFLYPVPDNAQKGTGVHIKSVTGGKNLNDVAVEDLISDISVITLEGVTMEPARLLAFSGVTTDKEIYGPTDKVKVTLDIDKTYSNWLDSDTMTLNGTKYLAKVYLKAGQYTYALKLDPDTMVDDEGTRYIAEISSLDYAKLQQTTEHVEVYYDGTYDGTSGTFSGGNLVAGITDSFDVEPVILIKDIVLDKDVYPIGNRLYKMAETATTLKIAKVTLSDGSICTTMEELEQKATFPEILWYSGDTDMAVIDRTTGTITVKSLIPGEVQFRAAAANNGLELAEVFTDTFTVEVGGPPNVLFQQGSDTFIADRNGELTIQWVETVTSEEEYKNAEFAVELFEGDYRSKDELKTAEENGTAVCIKNWSITGSNAQYTIPANILSKVSQNNVPVYTVRVSTDKPYDTGNKLNAIAHIVVIPKPAKVRFAKLDNYYILDTNGTVNINWTLEEYTGGEFSFSIKKNGVPFDEANTRNIGVDKSIYNLTADKVPDGTLKDVYTVTVKTKNTTDSAYSTDSFLLHVYDADAMKLWIDGEEPEKTGDDSYKYTMDNNAGMAALYGKGGAEGRDAILNLQRNISLKNIISINYKDYPYGAVTDQIGWDDGSSQATEGTYEKVATVNYPASSYTDIMDMGYNSFRPSTEFLLAGLKDGETTITATHAGTGQTLTLDLSVVTLKDKLYLFQFYPAQETKVVYTNGAGEEVTLFSNERGELAVYEESGIKSDISLSSGSGAELYLGTLYMKDLVTQEGNSAYNELYPQNNFKLRKAATLELYIKDVDGKPYTGDITYRGAVYKNGKLCADTMTGATQVVDGILCGEAAKSITLDSEGKFELIFDATQFWTEHNGETLKVTDKIEFIYEVHFADDAYYPQLIIVNGNINEEDVADFGENIVIIKACSEVNKFKPFVSTYYVDYGLHSGRLLDVTDYTGNIGVTDRYQDTRLNINALLWGIEPDDVIADSFEVDILRQDNNRKLDRQSQRVYSYPFSTMPYLSNVVSLAPESTKLGKGEQTSAEVCLKNNAGYSKTVATAFKLTNMIGVQAVNESSDVEEQLDGIKQSGMKQYGLLDLYNGESFLNVGMSLVSQNNGASLLDNSFCQLKLVATEDPAIYRGIILLNVDAIGETNRPMIDFPGEADERFNYKPTMLDTLKAF